MSWILRMAWRDTRGSRRRLAVFLLAMIVGVAALVAINSFGENLRLAVDDESKTLLGADLALESRGRPSEAAEAFVDSLGGEKSRRISFTSMALFPNQEATRLMTVRAVEGRYPYYGSIETRPADAVDRLQTGEYALVDATVMEEYGLSVGDSVRVGRKDYEIIGHLDRTPRESTAFMLASPRIYLPVEHLDRQLLGAGSRVSHEFYLYFGDGRDVDLMVEELRERMRSLELRPETVEDVRQTWDQGLANVYRFLGLVAFIAVLLGAVGVASAVHVFVRSRIDTIAILRCLGAAGRKPFTIYLIQAISLGLIGAVAGSLLGSAVQVLLPVVMADFLPVDVSFGIAWTAVGTGIAIGLVVTVVFALLPLLAVRNVPPLRAIRSSVEPQKGGAWLAKALLFVMLAAGIVAFAVAQAPNTFTGIGYAIGLAAVFAALTIAAKLLMFASRRLFRQWWPYVIRQGVANLFRPQNQTLLLVVALGLGTFLIVTLFLVQETLVGQIRIAEEEGQPDLVFFDVQSNQIEGVEQILKDAGLPVIQSVPIVSMRISAINGRRAQDIRQDTLSGRSGWALTREYRSSYRDHLTPSERILTGRFIGEWDIDAGPVPISMERELAQELQVAIDDTITFAVHGRPIETTVASIREVDWRRLSTNFFIIFPTGVLEEAPRFYVVLTRAGETSTAARAQRAVVQAHPNVSSIDLKVILSTFDALFGRISAVLQFMALFSIVAGVFVLGGAVMVSRARRTEETVLLKTLGASRKQVVRIMIVEYFVLGLLSSAAGLVLAYGASWGIATFVFEISFQPALEVAAAAVVSVVALAVVVGLINSRGIYRRAPLEVLRAEV